MRRIRLAKSSSSESICIVSSFIASKRAMDSGRQHLVHLVNEGETHPSSSSMAASEMVPSQDHGLASDAREREAESPWSRSSNAILLTRPLPTQRRLQLLSTKWSGIASEFLSSRRYLQWLTSHPSRPLSSHPYHQRKRIAWTLPPLDGALV